MVGTQKWSMEEILWVITMVKQGLKDEEIYEKFCELFKNARHVKGASSIKYCRTIFMKQEEYSQEKYWEDAPGKIGFVLGRHNAGVYNGQIVADVMQHFSTHIWAPHVRPTAKCIEFVITKYRKLQNRFTDYTRENPLVEPVIRLSTEGISPEDIFKTANENGISLDDIYYIVARFWLEVKLYPTAFDISNYGQHSGVSSAGASTNPGTVKKGPLIFQLSPKPSNKKPKAEGSHHNSRHPSNSGSRVSHHSHGHEFFGWAGSQMTRRAVQQNLDTSLLNSGYPQEISSGASSQAQRQGLLRHPLPGNDRPLQQHGMGVHHPQIQQDGQLQHLMALPGQLNQQNWSHEPAFINQPGIPEQPQNGFGGYQQVGGMHDQRIYGSSSQAGQISYVPQPGHHLMRAFNMHPQQFLAQDHRQLAVPLTYYENIDPALLQVDTNQSSCPNTGIPTHSQPPLTPRIAPQDLLHPFNYSGAQSGQDISPLTIENPQFPVRLPPSPEVVHGEFEHRGQLTRPDPFAQRSTLTEYPQSGLGADPHQSSGMNGLDRDDFDLALTLSNYNNAATTGHENTCESGYSVWDAIDHSDDQKMNAKRPSSEQAGQGSNQNPTPVLLTTNEEAVAGCPITNQEPLSEAQLMEWNSVEEATNLRDLSELFPDLEYQSPLEFNFNYDGSIIGGDDINHSEKDTPGNGPQDKSACDAKFSLEAMEAVSRNLETGMAGPFLTQNLIEDSNDSGGVHYTNSGVFDDWAPEGTCCARHQNFECYFEIPELDGEDATVSKC